VFVRSKETVNEVSLKVIFNRFDVLSLRFWNNRVLLPQHVPPNLSW